MLPRHPIYRKLDSAVTFLGIELEDWFGLGVTFVILSQVSDLLVGRILRFPRGEAGVSALLTGLVFLVWRRVRERTPRNFFRHLLEYLGEPEAYIISSDQDAIPYII